MTARPEENLSQKQLHKEVELKTGGSKWVRLSAMLFAFTMVAAACGSTTATAISDEDVEETTTEQESDEVEVEEEAEAEEEADAETISATIGILNIAPVVPLELLNQGFADGLGQCDAVDATIDYRDVNGDGSLLEPITLEFLEAEVDLILALSTPVLQTVAAINEADGGETPVLFGGVTDPFAAGVATAADDKPSWLTGWQAEPPVIGMFDTAEQINPDTATIGIVYEPSQVNSQLSVAKMEAEAEARGWAVEITTIADETEVGAAAADLATRDIDFFFVPADSILINGLAGMVPVAAENDIPMIAQDSGTVSAGAAIGLGLDYYGDGVRNAQYACQILSGQATPADFPIDQFPDELVRYSEISAVEQGFEIPESILNRGESID